MIDWNLFDTYLGSFSKDFVLDLIDTFIKSYPETIAKLRHAVAAKDYPAVEGLAHQLKTNCNWFGATVAGDLALQMEKMAKKLMEDRMEAVLSQFEPAAEELIRELSNYKITLTG